MRMSAARAIVLCSAVTVLPAVLVACGGTTSSSGASTPSATTAAKQGGTVKLLMGTAPDYPGPAGGLHDAVGRGDLDLVHRPVHLRAQDAARPAAR